MKDVELLYISLYSYNEEHGWQVENYADGLYVNIGFILITVEC